MYTKEQVQYMIYSSSENISHFHENLPFFCEILKTWLYFNHLLALWVSSMSPFFYQKPLLSLHFLEHRGIFKIAHIILGMFVQFPLLCNFT